MLSAAEAEQVRDRWTEAMADLARQVRDEPQPTGADSIWHARLHAE